MQITNSKTTSPMRGIAKVDSNGKISVPDNILRAMNLEKENLIELRFIGGKGKKLVLSKL